MASAVVPAVLREPRAAWAQAPASIRAAYATGTVLMAVGMAHGIAWLVLGGAWEGPVSYRKPFSFGMSFGLTTITLAWLTQRLGVPRRGAWIVIPIAAASVTEVAWVSLQRARGVPSHFNVGTPLDELLFNVVGGVGYVALVVAATLQWLAGRPLSEPGLLDGAVAAAGGAALLAAVSIALRNRGAPTAAGPPGSQVTGSQVTPAS